MAKLNDKIELKLDTKKLLVLLLGGLGVACLIFLMGFMAGQSGRKTKTPPQPAASQPDPIGQVIEKTAHEEATPPKLGFHESLTSEKVQEDFEAQPKTPPAPLVVETQPVAPPKPAEAVEPQPKPVSKPTPQPQPEKKPATSPPAAAMQGDAYLIQVSAGKSQDSSQALVKKLNKAGFKTKLEPFERNGERWYRVVATGYADRESAQADAIKIKEGFRFSPFVRKR